MRKSLFKYCINYGYFRLYLSILLYKNWCKFDCFQNESCWNRLEIFSALLYFPSLYKGSIINRIYWFSLNLKLLVKKNALHYTIKYSLLPYLCIYISCRRINPRETHAWLFELLQDIFLISSFIGAWLFNRDINK